MAVFWHGHNFFIFWDGKKFVNAFLCGIKSFYSKSFLVFRFFQIWAKYDHFCRFSHPLAEGRTDPKTTWWSPNMGFKWKFRHNSYYEKCQLGGQTPYKFAIGRQSWGKKQVSGLLIQNSKIVAKNWFFHTKMLFYHGSTGMQNLALLGKNWSKITKPKKKLKTSQQTCHFLVN